MGWAKKKWQPTDTQTTIVPKSRTHSFLGFGANRYKKQLLLGGKKIKGNIEGSMNTSNRRYNSACIATK